ncbi:MAG: hypothetical protein JO275_12220 [Verrucomicrobia bacterium]|nr:hypothetical protein [Verrucomicrobiota bacterium]
MKGIPNSFVALWCVLMPVTSFLVIRSAQGTIPAYILAFISVGLVILGRDSGQPCIQRRHYITLAVAMGAIWLLLLCGSQLGHLISGRRDFGELFLNNQSDTRVVLRPVLFTQTLYLAACFCIALFFRFFFRPEWMRYVLWGAWFLAIYGIYEWLFFLVFQQPGDFLGNRTYGEDLHTGSWSQSIQFGPFNLLRIKSTYGEPSFLSAAVVPYLLLALENRKKLLSAALLFCTVFSTSTSAYAGLAFALFIYCILKRKFTLPLILILLLFAGALVALYFAYPDTFDAIFTNKINGEAGSGDMHQAANDAMIATLKTFDPMNAIFGIGFGYYYGSVLTTMLINTGLIGLAVYCYAFLKPAILLRSSDGGLGLKVAIATIFFLYCINVSEFFLPTTWMFLGLAYWRLDQQKLRDRSGSSREMEVPARPGFAHARGT